MKKIFFAMLAFTLLSAFPLSASMRPAEAFEIEWKNNFGGSGDDIFNSATALPDGFVAVGASQENSFGNGDWSGFTGRGGRGNDLDAIIVKYDTVVMSYGEPILVAEAAISSVL